MAGIIVLIPLTITYMVLRALYNILRNIFTPLLGSLLQMEKLPHALEVVFVVLLAGVVLYLVGLLSRIIAVKRLIAWGEKILTQIPLIKFFYQTSKQVLESLQLMKKQSMNRVVIVEFPRKGIMSLAFVTGEMKLPGTDEYLVNLFLPTTPNPTTGFFFMAPPDQVWDVNISMEEAMKMIVSGGIIRPREFEMKPYIPGVVGKRESQDHEI